MNRRKIISFILNAAGMVFMLVVIVFVFGSLLQHRNDLYNDCLKARPEYECFAMFRNNGSRRGW